MESGQTRPLAKQPALTSAMTRRNSEPPKSRSCAARRTAPPVPCSERRQGSEFRRLLADVRAVRTLGS
eukprot:6550078-Alexandrium_andersonii.AAC.1